MVESRGPDTAQAPAYPRLLGDIGGTNARFGWQAEASAPITHMRVLPCSEYISLHETILHYLHTEGLSTPPCAALGIANPVTSDQVAMTNHHWKFSIQELRQSLGLSRLLLLNDFTALALALPVLNDQEKQQIGGTQAVADAAIGLIGPGTGLGVSGLVPTGLRNKWTPITGEGGHVTLSATTPLEFAVIQQLQKRYGHVSAERVVSGAGLVDLYHTLCDLKDGQGREITTPAEVLERAQEHPNSTADQAVDLFCSFLGSTAGDLALTLGARGGVYIGGGIVPRLGSRFETSSFRARFENKGRFKNYLHNIPTWIIHSTVSPALQGAAQALSLNDS